MGCGSCCGRDQKKILLLVLGDPFIACCLFGLFINQPVSPCQTDHIVIYVPVFFWKPVLLLPHSTCHVMLFYFPKYVTHCSLGPNVCAAAAPRFLNSLSLAAIIRCIFIWKRQSAVFCFRSSLCLYLEIPNGAPWGCGLWWFVLV